MTPPPALLAISHGTGSPAGQRAVAALVAAVAARAATELPGVDVRLGHVDVQQPEVEASLAALGDRPTVIVPLLLSAGYHVHVDLRRAAKTRHDVTVAAPLGPDPRLAQALAARLTQAGTAPDDAIVLAVAGSSDERANDDCREIGRMLQTALAQPVTVAFLAAADPRLPDAIAEAAASEDRIAVATYLLAPGYFHDLAVRQATGHPVARPLLDDDAPPAALVDLVLDRYRAAAARQVHDAV